MQWTITTPPATTPIDPTTLPYHLRLDSDLATSATEQSYLAELLSSATEYAETAMQASLITRTITATYYDSDELILPRGPVIGLVSVTNGDGNSATGATLERRGNTDILVMPAGWIQPLTVVFTAGFGTASANIPADIRQAIRVHVGSMYEYRNALEERSLYVVPNSLDDFYQRKCRVGVAQ
jgi:uncharacterized phiE125 gp8 family phage protein